MLVNKELDDIINSNLYKFYAHTKESSSDKELLSAHLELTYKYYKEMLKEKKLDIIVKDLIKSAFNINDEITNIGYEFFESAIYYHDIGKINPMFQKNKMNNNLEIKHDGKDSTHSGLSAKMYIDSFYKVCLENNSMELAILLFMFGYIISRHHSNISDMVNFYKDLEQVEDILFYKCKLNDNQYKKIIVDKINKYLDKENVDEISIYILGKLLYSCLVTADFYATYEYMTGNKVCINGNKNDELFDRYKKSELYNNIREYEGNKKPEEGINKLRNDIFLETEKSLKNNLDGNIFYLEAPTGAGKTNMAINLSRILYEEFDEIKSINYIFPFNTIVEQTEKTFLNYFEKYKNFMTINSISNMVKDVNECLDFEQAYLKNSFRQYDIVITSHINLFDSLFGQGKEDNYSLYNYINSVIVLDEIQTYSNNKWRQIIEMFSKYAEKLNIKFIIMSATLPRLDKLLNETHNKFIALVEDTNKYYQNSIFKNRVITDYSLLSSKIELAELAKIIAKNKNKKVLVECITKKTANELYQLVKEIRNEDVYILTGDDNHYYRNILLEKIKNKKDIILIATQTIEAGADIDMDIGYKNISFLDNEEQFLGRINRSSKKKNCKAYFFYYDDASKIYLSDKRIGLGINKEEIRYCLEQKDFTRFYDLVLNRVHNDTQKYDAKNIANLFNDCKFMYYRAVQEKMQLIKDSTIQLFLNYTIEVDGKKIIGREVFEEFKSICNDNTIKYAEKKIRLSSLQEKMDLFLYTIFKNECNIVAQEDFGNIYYIEDGEKYLIDGRFNREMFLNEGDNLFI